MDRMMYEVGKLRMQEFIESAERKRMMCTQDTKDRGFSVRKIRWRPSPDLHF